MWEWTSLYPSSSVFHHAAWCQLWVFHKCSLSWWGISLLFLICWVFLWWKKYIGFCQMLFLCGFGMIWFLIFHWYEVPHWLSDVKPILPLCHKSHLIMMCNSFYMLLFSVCYYLLRIFCMGEDGLPLSFLMICVRVLSG